MNRADLPGLVVAAFGLSSEELTALKILRPSSYPMINCTDNFELLLTRRPICIVLNPFVLSIGRRKRLNEHMSSRIREPDSPIFLVTRDTEGVLAFPTLRVSLTARRDRTRSRIMKQLMETDIDPFFAFDYDKAAPPIALNDGFVVLDADMNTYARTPREIIRLSAVYVFPALWRQILASQTKNCLVRLLCWRYCKCLITGTALTLFWLLIIGSISPHCFLRYGNSTNTTLAGAA